MKKFFEKPYWFGVTYGAVLVAAMTFVLLDTFVIPKSMVVVSSVDEGNVNSNADTVSASEDNSSSTGVFTDMTYQDDNISITITESTEYNTQIYVADIVVSDISQLKTAFANSTYGRNIKETTSDMAESVNAILAINGDYYGFRDAGYVIRNGTLYRDTSNDVQDLAIMSDGTFEIIDEDTTSANSILEEGALQVLSFGPALVNDGNVVVAENTEVEQAQTSNPRTAIGMISPLHYVIIISDGRTDVSEGLTLYQLAGLFEEEGCSVAYNLDGGGSTTLWFNGEVINNPSSGKGIEEREVSDIVYIGY